MNTIVAVADGFAIGKNGDLLVRLPEDLRRFKELTTGKVVVMGYNTFLSLPGSRPLKNRTQYRTLPRPDRNRRRNCSTRYPGAA